MTVAAVNPDILERLTFAKWQAGFKKVFDPAAELYVAYNNYRGSVSLTPTVEKIYPLPKGLKGEPGFAPILEPTPAALVEKLFYGYVEAKFFQIVLNSIIGEASARLMVLNSAVDNSDELIDSLQVAINKTRQAAITRDLSEVVASAETMRGDLDE